MVEITALNAAISVTKDLLSDPGVIFFVYISIGFILKEVCDV
jgi:hypothetical protein